MLKLDNDKDVERFLAPYRIDSPRKVSLADHDPGDTDSLSSDYKDDANGLLERAVDWMAEQQPKLAAENNQALLLIFQGRDAAGKDSMIRKVMSGMNPQGCHVTSFKHPSDEALDHDYLWRYHTAIPGSGEIGIFNRSYYEEVLIVRVHRHILDAQGLPPELVTKNIWRERFEDINHFERYLARNGVHVLKFFLNISAQEQRERFLERLEHPEKHWKFSQADIDERAYWDDYTLTYEEAIGETASAHAPWFVVPADHKWFARLVVAAAVASKLRAMDPQYPKIDGKQAKAIEAARKALN
ncbi:MAG: polyphosphate kinase 2 family protein [Gammaproteobacteria bacterium]|jgi:PPK2 family polyphosphate:nucleotide phosphotransferase|nr:MAG: polyphosphate kinase 2 family protein [Gammaproteobacteria bacterium]